MLKTAQNASKSLQNPLKTSTFRDPQWTGMPSRRAGTAEGEAGKGRPLGPLTGVRSPPPQAPCRADSHPPTRREPRRSAAPSAGGSALWMRRQAPQGRRRRFRRWTDLSLQKAPNGQSGNPLVGHSASQCPPHGAFEAGDSGRRTPKGKAARGSGGEIHKASPRYRRRFGRISGPPVGQSLKSPGGARFT